MSNRPAFPSLNVLQPADIAPLPAGTGSGVVDPVCGMTVDPATAAGGHFDHAGTLYSFCCDSCRRKFSLDPERYLNPDRRSATAAAAPPGTTYTCPMHPEVVTDRPSSCPLCGMALEPTTVSLDDADNPELRLMSRRFWGCLALTAPLLALAMGGMVPGLLGEHGLESTAGHWLQLALATPVVVWGAWPFFERAWGSIRHRSANMFTLIAIGVGTAYGESLLATVAPGWFPASFRGHSNLVPVYFEAAATVTTLVLLGQVLELRARGDDHQRLEGVARSSSQDRAPTQRRRHRGRRAAR